MTTWIWPSEFWVEKNLLILGTTWVSCILDLLYFGQTFPERQTSIPINERVPFLEIVIPDGPSEHTGCITVTLPRQHTTKPCVIFLTFRASNGYNYTL